MKSRWPQFFLGTLFIFSLLTNTSMTQEVDYEAEKNAYILSSDIRRFYATYYLMMKYSKKTMDAEMAEGAKEALDIYLVENPKAWIQALAPYFDESFAWDGISIEDAIPDSKRNKVAFKNFLKALEDKEFKADEIKLANYVKSQVSLQESLFRR